MTDLKIIRTLMIILQNRMPLAVLQGEQSRSHSRVEKIDMSNNSIVQYGYGEADKRLLKNVEWKVLKLYVGISCSHCRVSCDGLR